MADMFNATIVCNKCNTVMQETRVIRNGFLIRAFICPICKDKMLHPGDLEEYHKFNKLKNKDFKVKLRVVGNSYAVSIPKEIVNFIREQERIMDDMVRLVFEETGKLSLMFHDEKFDRNFQEGFEEAEEKEIEKAKEEIEEN